MTISYIYSKRDTEKVFNKYMYILFHTIKLKKKIQIKKLSIDICCQDHDSK